MRQVLSPQVNHPTRPPGPDSTPISTPGTLATPRVPPVERTTPGVDAVTLTCEPCHTTPAARSVPSMEAGQHVSSPASRAARWKVRSRSAPSPPSARDHMWSTPRGWMGSRVSSPPGSVTSTRDEMGPCPHPPPTTCVTARPSGSQPTAWPSASASPARLVRSPEPSVGPTAATALPQSSAASVSIQRPSGDGSARLHVWPSGAAATRPSAPEGSMRTISLPASQSARRVPPAPAAASQPSGAWAGSGGAISTVVTPLSSRTTRSLSRPGTPPGQVPVPSSVPSRENSTTPSDVTSAKPAAGMSPNGTSGSWVAAGIVPPTSAVGAGAGDGDWSVATRSPPSSPPRVRPAPTAKRTAASTPATTRPERGRGRRTGAVRAMAAAGLVGRLRASRSSARDRTASSTARVSDIDGHPQGEADLGETAVEVVAQRPDAAAEQARGLGQRVAVAVHQQHRGPLALAEPGQRPGQARLVGVLAARDRGRARARPRPAAARGAAGRGLADPPQVAGGVAHGLHPVEVLPRPGEGVGGRVRPPVRPVGGYERPAQARLDLGAQGTEARSTIVGEVPRLHAQQEHAGPDACHMPEGGS